jgi:hypothetical protein
MPTISRIDLKALNANKNIIARNYWKDRLSGMEFMSYFGKKENSGQSPADVLYDELTAVGTADVEEPWERTGNVPNVVFPTGTSFFENRLYIYYGGADTRIGVASISLDELMKELLSYPA